MKIYVAGPYSRSEQFPDMAANVRVAIGMGDRLLAMGHAPFIPHLTHFWHMLCPHPYEAWLVYDREWLLVCDAILRMPGDSPGADREVEWAREAGLLVFNGIQELEDYSGGAIDQELGSRSHCQHPRRSL